jgi:hypothetical protein
MTFRAKALDVGTFVFQTPLLKNSQVRSHGAPRFPFRQAKIERCQVLARQVIGKTCRGQTDGAVLKFQLSMRPPPA